MVGDSPVDDRVGTGRRGRRGWWVRRGPRWAPCSARGTRHPCAVPRPSAVSSARVLVSGSPPAGPRRRAGRRPRALRAGEILVRLDAARSNGASSGGEVSSDLSISSMCMPPMVMVMPAGLGLDLVGCWSGRVQSGVQIERNRAQLRSTRIRCRRLNPLQHNQNLPAGGRAVAGSNPVSPTESPGKAA